MLFTDPKSHYRSIPGVDCWDKSRDAKLYTGSHPIVAHPDCGPWSKLRHLSTKQDPECGPIAVSLVQQLGGVVEHPQYSRLWDHMGLPKPDQGVDEYGGRTYFVTQVSYGHKCVKPTWIYCIGIDHDLVLCGVRTGGTPTHCVCKGPRAMSLPVASKIAKRLTPPAFAEWLVSLAREVSLVGR